MGTVRASDRQVQDLLRVLSRSADSRALVAQLRKDMRAAAKPMLPALRSAIMRIPSQGESRRRGRNGKDGRRKSLRREMAKAATLQVLVSGRKVRVGVYMAGKKMPDRAKALPQYMEGSKGHEHWRHPTFGKWKAGQPDQPSHPYFSTTIWPMRDREVDAVRGVVERLARTIEEQ